MTKFNWTELAALKRSLQEKSAFVPPPPGIGTPIDLDSMPDFGMGMGMGMGMGPPGMGMGPPGMPPPGMDPSMMGLDPGMPPLGMDPSMMGMDPGMGMGPPPMEEAPPAEKKPKTPNGLLERLDEVVAKLEDIEARLGKGSSKKSKSGQEKEAEVSTIRMELDMLHDQVSVLTGMFKTALARGESVAYPTKKADPRSELLEDVLQLLER